MTETETNNTPNVAGATLEIPVTPTPAKPSLKGKYGKIGAPPKPIKFPRGSFTIKQLVDFNKGVVCELTVRNTVAALTSGVRTVIRVGKDGSRTKEQVKVPVTLVKLDKPEAKAGVGRRGVRFMSKAAFEANRANLKKALRKD